MVNSYVPPSTNSRPSDSQIKRKVSAALTSFLDAEIALLTRDASERSISHKLAVHLERQFPDWDIDCEYNRRGEAPKTVLVFQGTLSADDLEAKTVFPDIIVHKRGVAKNLLVIEIKKPGNSPGRTWDEQKLEAFTGREYGYKLGLFIEFDVQNRRVGTMKWFKSGAALQ